MDKNKEILIKIGYELAICRAINKHTQKDLANILKTQQTIISRIENGRYVSSNLLIKSMIYISKCKSLDTIFSEFEIF